MDLDAIPSGFRNDLVSIHGFAFRTKIIIDQLIAIYDDGKGIYFFFLECRRLHMDNFFVGSAPNSRIYLFDQSRECLFFVKDSKKFFFKFIFSILFTDKISLRS
jgi:hypothetical protein